MFMILRPNENGERFAVFKNINDCCFQNSNRFIKEYRTVTDDVVPFLKENKWYKITENDIIVIDFPYETTLRFDLYSFHLYFSNERNYSVLPKNRKRDWRGYFVYDSEIIQQ
jgi:hypothetical protein